MLLAESMAALSVRPGGIYVDATFGAGGHTREILARRGTVVALDRDAATQLPPDLQRPAADAPFCGVTLVHRNFADISETLDALGIPVVDGVLFDLGVSSMQFGRPERGFSFLHDGPLDMRMNAGGGPTAYDLLVRSSEAELADILFTYGEERAARRIARALVAARGAGRLPRRTLELARLVSGLVHRQGTRERLHPATRTFQALRIAVNDELNSLERGLDAATARLRPGGRLAAISFHSLEDRIVKRHMRGDDRLRALTRKPLSPSDEELERNARARSARLRVAERL